MRSPAICDWVFEHARRTPDASAVDTPEERVTYGLLARRIVAVGRALERSGFRAGDRALVVLSNAPAAVVVSLAVQHVGGVVVEVSREWSAAQLAGVVAQVRPRAIAAASADARKLADPAIREVAAFIVHRGTPPDPARLGLDGVDAVFLSPGGEIVGTPADEAPPSALPARDAHATTLLLYTSGSTAAPRAVMQTMSNIAENTRAIIGVLQLTAQDRAMLILPLSYCYGRSVLQTHLYVGGSVFLDPRFMYPRVVLDAIGSERCTGFAGVPLTFELLRRRAEIDMRRMTSLRYVTQAGGAMSPDTVDWARTAFAPAKVFVMYGQTEATARLSYVPPERAQEKRGSIGVPIPGVDLRVVDDAGAEVAPGVHGHLVARGPNVTPGYFDAPEETARILRDGWLWTGDVACRDNDGFLRLVGRAKDMLKVGGHRVAPAQVEDVVARHGDVVDVAVAGVPDPLLGEATAALVVARPGVVLTDRDVQRFCGERLPPYLVPRAVRFVEAIPRGPSGKVLREQVARVLAATREPTHVDERSSA